MDKLLEFVTPFPTISKTGKNANVLVTPNTSPKWMRYGKTKIKNSLKKQLGNWTIPIASKTYRDGKAEFTILRHNNRRLDADSVAWIAKWIVDFCVEQKHFVDDDRITFILNPSILNSDVPETSIKVTIYGGET